MGHRRSSTITATAITILVVGVAAIGFAPAASASKADDLKTGRAGLLVAGDFPTGWTGARSTPPSDASVIKATSKIATCKDYVKLRKLTVANPKARSLEFSDETNTTVSNVVSVFSSSGKAEEAMGYWSSTDMPDCLEQYTQKLLNENGGEDATVSVASADVDELGADAVGYTADITDSSGTTVESLLTVAIPVGQFVDVYTLDVTSSDAPFTTVESAIKTSLDRLEAAAG